jgi:fucose permease
MLGPTLFFVCLTAGRLVGGLLGRVPPRVFFQLSAGLGIVGLATVTLGAAPLAVAGVVVCGLAFANIWPLLFSLTVERRPERSSELSGLMCMAICGGAILPPLMGYVRDHAGFAVAFLIPAAAFAYLALLAFASGRQAQEA